MGIAWKSGEMSTKSSRTSENETSATGHAVGPSAFVSQLLLDISNRLQNSYNVPKITIFENPYSPLQLTSMHIAQVQCNIQKHQSSLYIRML